MAGLPVTIRLLDPPLHEFLPPLEEAADEQMRERIKALHETNPMLGTRGCRLGLQWPEIYEMQVRAIVRAAKAVETRTGAAPQVEIMHPLVAFAEELARLRDLTERTVAEEGGMAYACGTMIELRARACAPTRSPSTPTSSRSGRTTSLRRHSDSHATTPKAHSFPTTSTSEIPRARSVPDARSARAWAIS